MVEMIWEENVRMVIRCDICHIIFLLDSLYTNLFHFIMTSDIQKHHKTEAHPKSPHSKNLQAGDYPIEETYF